MPREPRHRVTPLPDGTFRVVTMLERVLTEAQMKAEGIPVPRQELPWPEEKAGPPPEAMRRSAFAEARTALEYWKRLMGGFDPRLPAFLRSAVPEFGLERVLAAMDEVGAVRTPEQPYLRFRKIFRRLREGD